MNARLSGRSATIGLSKLATAAANAGVLFVAAHALDAAAFGVFGAATAAILLLGRIATLSCEHAFMRLRALPEHDGADAGLLGATLVITAGLSAVLVLGALPVLSAVAPGSRWPVAATVAAAIGWALVELSYWIFLARGHHHGALAAQAGTAVLRFLVVAAVAVTLPGRDALLVAWAGSGAGLGAVAIGFAARGAHWPGGALVATMLRYTRWQGVAQLLSALGGQLAILMLLLVGDQPVEAGKFSLALSLMFGIFLIYAGLFEHLSAEVAVRGAVATRRFLSLAMRWTGAMLALSVLVLAAEYLVAPWLLPAEIWAGGSVFVPLALAALVILAHAPLEALLHGRLRPRAILEARVIRIAVIAAFGIPLSQTGDAAQMALLQLGAAGLSWAYLCVRARG